MICKNDLSVTVFKIEGNKNKRSFQNKNKYKRKYD